MGTDSWYIPRPEQQIDGTSLEKAIPLGGKIYVSPERGAEVTGVNSTTLSAYAKRRLSWFGTPIDIVEHGGHWMINERDLVILAAVNKKFPIGKGPIPRAKRELMRTYAARLRTAFDKPAP